MSTKTISFQDQVLGQLNKDEATVQQENVVDTIADYKIQCETQIGFLTTGTIPQLQLSLNQENRALLKAEKDLENAFLQIVGSDFQTYISNITNAEDAVELAKESVEEIKSEIETKKVQIEKFQSLLKRLGA